MNAAETLYTQCDSPIGPLTVAAQGDAIVACLMHVHRHAPGGRDAWRLVQWSEHGVLDMAVRQLDEYFTGSRMHFDLPLEPDGTDMQKQVWRALREIPFGETRSYGAIALRIGRPTASRAVGAANGRNPIAIIVPCHRVIGASGALTGFGGGIERKQWLLSHETRLSPAMADAGVGAPAGRVGERVVPQDLFSVR